MSLMLAKSFQESSGGGRRTPSRKTGFMSKGKSQHRGRPDEPAADPPSSNILNMDPDTPYRTHMLFYGRGGDEAPPDGRASGSPSLLQSVFRGKRPGPTGLPLDFRNLTPEMLKYRTTPEMDSTFRTQLGKQVSFIGDELYTEVDVRMEKKPNSYNCDPPPQSADKNFQNLFSTGRTSAPNNVSRQPSFAENDGKSRQQQQLQQPPPPRRPPGPGSQSTQQPEGSSMPDGRQPPPRMRRPIQPRGGGPDDRSSYPPSTNVTKDCFVIPQENLERFLPDGITLPREPQGHPLINILEVDDPKLGIVFHLMHPFTSLNPQLDSPLATPLALQRKLAEEELAKAKELNASEGFLLKNLEKDSEYPFINYFVIHKPHQEMQNSFRDLRINTYNLFCATKTGYACRHSVDFFHEVATIARPPVEPISKKPVTDLTGYIICLYRVFKGDDGEKFERNWLYWTGARMLYKNLPKAVGLRRITLHKSASNDQEIVYLLLVECTHFMDHIGETANLLPILRARICGYTGIFRVADPVQESKDNKD